MLEVRDSRLAAVRETLAGLGREDLERLTTTPRTPGHPPPGARHTVVQCLHEVLNEEWWHRRYAERDLDALLGATSLGPG